MDQKRLFLAIAISIAILLGFQLLIGPHAAASAGKPVQTRTAADREVASRQPSRAAAAGGAGATARRREPRLLACRRTCRG